MARALDIGEVPALLEAMIAGLDPSVEVEERAGGKASSATGRPPCRPRAPDPPSASPTLCAGTGRNT